MSNPYYTPSGAPASLSRGTSSVIRAEFALVEAAFDDIESLFAKKDSPTFTGSLSATLNTFGVTSSGIANISVSGIHMLNLFSSGGAGSGVKLGSGTSGDSANVHVYFPSKAGVPSSTPGGLASSGVPMMFDTTNVRLYAYIGGAWRYAQLT